MKTGFSSRLGQFLAAIVLLTGIYFTQLMYDGWKMAMAQGPKISANELIEPHPMPSRTLKKVSIGLDNLIADITWLQTIQYYGGGVPYEKYRRLPEMLTNTTQMDRRFAYPYNFGVLVLPGEGFTKEAVELGTDGMKNPNMKKEWEIPYYLGMIYHFQLKDYLKAAELFNEASNREGAPPITKLMAANYYGKANQRETAFALYAVVYKTTKNEYVKERAKQNLEHWQLIFDLEGAAKAFKEKYGRFPTSLQELVQRGIIKGIPPDPLGVELTINPQTGVVSEVEKK